MLELHTWDPNSNSGKPIFTLKEKGVEFEYHHINLLEFEQHSPEYLRINPSGTVPTLIHDGMTFTESTPLCEYIDNVFDGPSLQPDDPMDRYRMRWWCWYIDTQFAPALSVLGWHSFMGPMVRKKDPEEIERLIARIPTKERRIAWSTAVKSSFTEDQLENARGRVNDGIQLMNARLAESEYLACPTYSLADTVAFANAYALPVSVPQFANREKAPDYMAWLDRIYKRPATRQAFEMGRTPLAERALEVIKKLET
ncbi:MAG: glutathione S-transferase family protein [Gammaproteobacteria bacterium]